MNFKIFRMITVVSKLTVILVWRIQPKRRLLIDHISNRIKQFKRFTYLILPPSTPQRFIKNLRLEMILRFVHNYFNS